MRAARRRYSGTAKELCERQVQHQLPFCDHFPADAGLRFELPKLADLCQLFRTQQDLFLGPHRRQKLHRADGREQEEGPFTFRKSRGGCDPGGLRQRFRQDHARDERISREVAGEHWIFVREERQALGELAGFAAQQLPNENERRPVRKRSNG